MSLLIHPFDKQYVAFLVVRVLDQEPNKAARLTKPAVSIFEKLNLIMLSVEIQPDSVESSLIYGP